MRLGDQRDPFLSWLAADPLLRRQAVEARRLLGLAVRVGAAVDRVRQQAVDRGVAGPLPHQAAIGTAGRQLEIFFEEPEQDLTGRAQLVELGEHQLNRLLHAEVRVFLQTLVVGLYEPNGCRDDQLAAFRLRTSRLGRSLTQQVELVLVEAPNRSLLCRGA